MSRTVTLAQLRTDIANQCDFSTSSTGRYQPGLLNRLINQSIQRFRERISNEGITHFLVSWSGTLPAGTSGNYAFQVLDLSSLSPSLVRTYGLDLTISGVVRSLEQRSFQERNEFTSGPLMTGQPLAWAHYQTTSIAIMPAPDTSYPYTIWYLPVLADMSADSDTFDGVAGWEIYVLWDCVCQLIARDQYASAYQQATVERDNAWTDIVRSATKVSSAGGAFVGRDSLGRAGLWGRGRVREIGGSPGSALPPQSSITNSMLVNRNGPIVIGRLPTTGGAVEDVPIPSLTSYMGKFAGSYPGLVPTGTGSPADSLRGDGSWGNGAVGASGLAITQLSPIPSPRLLGRVSAGSGTVEALTPTAVATLFPVFNNVDKGLVPGGSNGSNTAYLRGDGAWSVPSGFGIDQVLPIQSPSVLGRFTAGSGAVEQLTSPQVGSMVPWFDTSRAGLVPKPSGIVGNFLKDDGTWASAGGGGGGTSNNLPGAPTGSVQYNAGSGVFGGASGFLWDGLRLKRFGNLEMPTGTIRMGNASGVIAMSAMIGIDFDGPTMLPVDILSGRSIGGLEAQFLQWQTDGDDVLTSGRNSAIRRRYQRAQQDHRWFVNNVEKQSLDATQLALKSGQRLGMAQFAFPTGFGDKLAGWTPSGFANIATGITIVASGQALAFGPGPGGTGALQFSNLQTVYTTRSDGGAPMRVLEMGDDLSLGDGFNNGNVYSDTKSGGVFQWRNAFAPKMQLDNSGLRVFSGIDYRSAKLAFPTGFGDKLAGWTAGGIANTATGIAVAGSGLALAFGPSPADSGTIRLSSAQGARVLSSDGQTRQVVFADIDMGFGDGTGTQGNTYIEASSPGALIFRKGFAAKMQLDNGGLQVFSGIDFKSAKLAFSVNNGDKLGAWNSAGRAAIATGIEARASGMMLAIASGPLMHASGISLGGNALMGVGFIADSGSPPNTGLIRMSNSTTINRSTLAGGSAQVINASDDMSVNDPGFGSLNLHAGPSGAVKLTYAGVNKLTLDDVSLRVSASGLAMFGAATAMPKQIVTGGRSAIPALQSLIIALAAYGLVTDNTTP